MKSTKLHSIYIILGKDNFESDNESYVNRNILSIQNRGYVFLQVQLSDLMAFYFSFGYTNVINV